MPSRTRILAVDDNPMNLAVIEESLQHLYELKFAENGEEALRVAPEFQPDVVLLDVLMPRMDGYVVCHKLKSHSDLKNTRVLMVSAKVKPDERQRGYQAGADDYLVKPFTEDELCAKLRVLLRAKAADQVQVIEKGLADLYGTTGEVLAMISHLRDAETGEHLVRIRSYCHVLAGELRGTIAGDEIDDLFIDDLHYASVLHDVGKIAIPDEILKKRGALSAPQYEQMKQHTVIGERILNRLGASNDARATFFRMAANVARWHHENFDGSGYPDGRRAESIPLAARIVRVADAFDAITSARVYKPPHEPAYAREQIEKGAGTEFDPDVVAAFQRVFDEFVDLHKENDSPDMFELKATV